MKRAMTANNIAEAFTHDTVQKGISAHGTLHSSRLTFILSDLYQSSGLLSDPIYHSRRTPSPRWQGMALR
jgi:hypothetical protein